MKIPRITPRPNDRNMPTHAWSPSCNVLKHVVCCWLKFENLQIWANNTQHVATHRNRVSKRAQHFAPNNVAICCVVMLRSFGRGLRVYSSWIFNVYLGIKRNYRCFLCKIYELLVFSLVGVFRDLQIGLRVRDWVRVLNFKPVTFLESSLYMLVFR